MNQLEVFLPSVPVKNTSNVAGSGTACNTKTFLFVSNLNVGYCFTLYRAALPLSASALISSNRIVLPPYFVGLFFCICLKEFQDFCAFTDQGHHVV